jgi:hypothetical protein
LTFSLFIFSFPGRWFTENLTQNTKKRQKQLFRVKKLSTASARAHQCFFAQESFVMAYRLRLEAAELHYPRTFGYRIKKGKSEALSNRSTCNPL